MANDLLIQPDTESEAATATMDGCELDLTFGVPVEEKPILVDLYEASAIYFSAQAASAASDLKADSRAGSDGGQAQPLGIRHFRHCECGLATLCLFIGVKHYIERGKPQLQVTPIEVTEFKALRRRLRGRRRRKPRQDRSNQGQDSSACAGSGNSDCGPAAGSLNRSAKRHYHPHGYETAELRRLEL